MPSLTRQICRAPPRHLNDRRRIRVELLADLMAVEGDAAKDIAALRRVRLVLKGDAIVRGTTTVP